MRNNKKGFTLIELLAVIAILAILVVIAVPAVINVFSDAKKSSFVTQAQTIYKAVEQQIISDQIAGDTPVTAYCYIADVASGSTLTLEGTKKVSYKATVSGTNITSFIVFDGAQKIELSSATSHSVSDITGETDVYSETTTNPITSCN